MIESPRKNKMMRGYKQKKERSVFVCTDCGREFPSVTGLTQHQMEEESKYLDQEEKRSPAEETDAD